MNRTSQIRIAFGIVIISILLALVVGAVILAIGGFSPESDSNTLTSLSLLISTTFIAVPVIVYVINRGESLREQLRFNPISLNTIIATILLSIGLIILIDELDRLVYAIFGEPEYLEQLFEQLKITSLTSGVFIIGTTVIVAPLVEELLFRGFLQKQLEEGWQDITKAVLVTSLVFAIIHLNYYWIVQIYALGVILGYLSWYTGSILPGILLHSLNNGFAIALNNAGSSFEKIYDWHGHVSPIWLILAITLVSLGFKKLHNQIPQGSPVIPEDSAKG